MTRENWFRGSFIVCLLMVWVIPTTLQAKLTDIDHQDPVTYVKNTLSGEETPDLFDMLFSEAKAYYMEALIASYYGDTSEVNYSLDRTLQIVTDISELDSLSLLQQDDFNRFYEKLNHDFQTQFSYLNGDSGTYNIASIREEISQTITETVGIGDDTLVVLEDRPGHLPIVTSGKIERVIDYFQNREHERFQIWLDNSLKYRDIMLPILRKSGLPEEIFYLALIESGFNPVAYSYAHAAGTWQFIASTGALYGLKRNWWVDERRDPIKSTHAAAKYLTDLYDYFNDWFLTLAAYNCGRMRVLRAIRREETRDYWKLKSLPRQTRNYIPTLMAGIIIAKDPEKYGFKNRSLDTWKWDEIVLKRPYELESISRVSDIPTKEIKAYNPELRRWMTPPDVENYLLKLPYGKAKGLTAKLEDVPAYEDRPQFVTHRVRRGQNLSNIARRYHTSVSAVVAANNIRNRNQIRIGQQLRIPLNNYYSQRYTPSGDDYSIHTVSRGETLYGIANQYHVSLGTLRSFNNLYGKRFIYPGQKIKIPGKNNKTDDKLHTEGKEKLVHIVQRGETLSEIAERYHVGLSKVRYWNNIYGRYIYPGQRIFIYKSKES